jgi:hypothetical protein
VADLSSQTQALGGNIRGLRVNGLRAQRARYPNYDTENGFGSNLLPKSFLPTTPDPPGALEIQPPWPNRSTTPGKIYHNFNLGVGECFYKLPLLHALLHALRLLLQVVRAKTSAHRQGTGVVLRRLVAVANGTWVLRAG